MDAVDQARAVLDRLERIDALRQADAPAGMLLGEVRSLLCEAEAWVEADRPGEPAEAALDRCRDALSAGQQAANEVLTAG